MNNTINEKQKKLLLILPLLVIPFATLFFWALGGGRDVQAQSVTGKLQGLNMKLPGARLKNDSAENKLSFYEQAEKDSLKYNQARKDDPYYKADTVVKKDSLNRYDTGIAPKAGAGIGRSFSTHGFGNTNASLAANEQQINQKLAALNRQISQPAAAAQNADYSGNGGNSGSETEVKHIPSAIQKLGGSGAPDPEMEQLSGMLDKIQEIQNPALARQKLKAQSEKERGVVLPVSSTHADDAMIMAGSGRDASNMPEFQQNGFFDLDKTGNVADDNAISAVVHETQTLTAGSTIKLRLLQDIFINGRLIPKASFVFGSCTIEGERLVVDIKTIRYRNSVFPVSMHVFDQDGLAGLYVPGAITRDALKEGSDQALQSYDPMSLSSSVGAQAASAGIQMAKGIFSKKIKLIKVTVKAGYSVLLLNANQLSQ
jgi:conjugative transposon TraM protein